jgi:ribose transport system ATP-binding protein
MSGRTLADTQVAERSAAGMGEEVLDVHDLLLAPQGELTSFRVRKGEVVGLVGLEGHGQKEVLEALSGHVRTLGGEVRVHQGGRWSRLHDSSSAAKVGVSYVTGDRKRDGIFPGMSVDLNFAMTTLRTDVVGGWWLRTARRRARFAPFVDSLKIKMAGSDRAIETLSGGNQQKVLIARALAEEPRVLLLNDPTRGVDLETKADLYHTIRDTAERGVGVVFVSTETEEYSRLCDRVLVFRRGRIVAELPGDSPTSRVLDAMFGRTEPGGSGSEDA